MWRVGLVQVGSTGSSLSCSVYQAVQRNSRRAGMRWMVEGSLDRLEETTTAAWPRASWIGAVIRLSIAWNAVIAIYERLNPNRPAPSIFACPHRSADEQRLSSRSTPLAAFHSFAPALERFAGVY